MTNSRSTKRALLTSAFAIVICAAMLIGTSFAWFTDTASTAVNKIVSGKLDIELQYAKAWNSEGKPTEWADAEGKTLNFITADGRTDNILWEPGCTYKLPELRVVNKGNLAVKFEYIINGFEGSSKLFEAIEFGFIQEDPNGDAEAPLMPGATSLYWAVTGHMRDDAGNEYQNLSIEGLGITVVATQYTYENDSNGNDYDENAEYPEVITLDSATAGLDAAGSGNGNAKNAFEDAMTQNQKDINISLTGDVVYDLNGYGLPLGGADTETITINGNGNTVYFNHLNTECSSVMCNGVKLTIKNAVVDINEERSSATVWNSNDVVFNNGDFTFENVEFKKSVAINGTASFKNCSISDKNAVSDTYVLWVQAGSKVSLDNCVIDGKSNTSGKNNRAIAIKDQYVDDPGMTVLTVNNTVISSDLYAAVLVTSAGGANISMSGTDISATQDTVNAVWYDGNGGNITVSGCAKKAR